MASIKKFHLPGCKGSDCDCPWVLDHRPQGLYGPRQRVRFKTRKRAQRFLAETSTKVARGEYLDRAKVPTFGAVAEDWLRSKQDRRPGTVANWRASLNRHLLPRLGSLQLDRIDTAAIERVRDELRGGGLSTRTVSATLTTCAAIFKLAIRRGYMQTNPAALAERPFKSSGEVNSHEDQEEKSGRDSLLAVRPDQVLDPNEISALLVAAAPGLYRALLMTACLTGMRSGELFALRWDAVELNAPNGRGKIYVRRSLSWARADPSEAIRPRFYPPKTAAGVRTIPLPPQLVGALMTWKIQCPASDYDLVFPTANGAPIRRSNALRYGLWPALRRAGLRRVTMHSLRHSFASIMIMTRKPITQVQYLLGHSNPAVTLRVYSHWFKDMDVEALDDVAETVLGNATQTAEKWAVSGQWDGGGSRLTRVSA